MEFGDILIVAAAALTLAWGAFLFLGLFTVVRDLGPLEAPGSRIVGMAWVAQALGTAFVGGLLAYLIAQGQTQGPAFKSMCLVCAIYLGVLGVVAAVTGARSHYVLLRMTPLVQLLSAVLLGLNA